MRHFGGEQLHVAVDSQSGFVLLVKNVGLRGPMTLTVEQFGLAEREPAHFSWDGELL